MKSYETIKFSDGDFTLDVRVSVEEETIWLSKEEIALLYNRDRTVISRHIRNIFKEGVLTENSVCAKNARTGPDGKQYIVDFYNLDVVISVGHRVKSNRGFLLRTFLNDYFMSLSDTYLGNNTQVIIYNKGEISLSVNVSPNEDTVYLNENQIATLFDTTRQNVNLHIKNILKEGELSQVTSRKDFLQHLPDGRKFNIGFYNLDMILAIGFRVKSKQAIDFRKWAYDILKQFIFKGYAISDSRCLECQSSILELKSKYLELENKRNDSQITEERMLKVENEVFKIKERQNAEISYYQGDELRGFIEIKRYLESVKKEIIIFDNYFGHSFDEVLANLNVRKTIVTNHKNKKIETNENYIVVKGNVFHDRYIIVDSSCYYFGSSLEDLGKTYSNGHRISEEIIIDFIKSMKDKILKEGGYNLDIER